MEMYAMIILLWPLRNPPKRQSERRRELNIMYKDKIKKLIKKAMVFSSEKKNKEAMALLPDIYAILDKAAKKGVIKKNNASRRKSRLTKLFSK